MSNLYPRYKLLWSLVASGIGTTIAGNGASNGWQGNEPGDWPPAYSQETAIDLRDVEDIALMINVAAITGSPSLSVAVNGYDDQGNELPNLIETTAAITAAGMTYVGPAGLHGVAAGSYLVLPRWAQVAWQFSGSSSSLNGVEISLIGR